jgi:hypothetical protein
MAEKYKYLFNPLVAERPKTTCVMCFSRTNSATTSATVLPFSLTICAPTFFRKLDIGGQRLLILFARILAHINVTDVKLAIHRLGTVLI